MTEPYDCENCEHYVRITDGRTAKDRICIFDGECEHLPMTNEEWLKSLDTEQLEEFLFGIAYMCSFCGDEAHSTEEKMQQCHFGKCGCQRKDWEMWLKEKHNETV